MAHIMGRDFLLSARIFDAIPMKENTGDSSSNGEINGLVSVGVPLIATLVGPASLGTKAELAGWIEGCFAWVVLFQIRDQTGEVRCIETAPSI